MTSDDRIKLEPSWKHALRDEFDQPYMAQLREFLGTIDGSVIERDAQIPDEYVKGLAELGCFRIWIGSESGSQRILDSMDRGVKIEQVQQAVAMSRERGIQSGMFLMWGYEGEELEDIEATIRHVSKSQPDIFFTTVSYPIKGTPYYKSMSDRLVQLKPWSTSSDRELKIKGRHSQRFYSYADRLLKEEVQLARMAGTPAANSESAASLRQSIEQARAGLLSTVAEVDA